MKNAKLVMFLILFVFASMSLRQGVVAQDPSKVLSPGAYEKHPRKTLPPETVVVDPGRIEPLTTDAPEKGAPDPSMVYGYISLVDPTTNQPHLILNRDYDPPVARGYPSFSFVFTRVGTKEERRVPFTLGDGLTQVGIGERAAYLWGAELRHDRAFSGDPTKVDISGRVLRRAIRYNPDIWRFSTVEMGAYEIFGELRIDLSRREKPFSEFADLR